MTRKQFWLVLFCASAAYAADEALPKAETILDRYVEVTGGKKAHDKIKTAVMSGTMSMPAQNINATMKIYMQSPNLKYQTTDFPGMGVFEEGSDGKIAWAKSAMQGPRIKEGEEKDVALQPGLSKDANWRDYFTKVETLGVEQVNGKDCYKVQVTPKVGRPETRFFDRSTGMIAKIMSTYVGPMGEIQSEIYMNEFVTNNGVKTPKSITTKVMGREMSMKFDTVEYNVEIPAEKFKVPADVQALADKK